MGRLGFNFLRLKERKKDVEAGATRTGSQNESAELDEFVQAIEEKNRQIKSIRILLVSSLTLIIVLGAYIIFTQPRTFRKSTSSEDAADTELSKLQELNKQYSNKITDQEAQLRAMNSYKLNLEALRQKIKRDENHKDEAKENYVSLNNRFDSLQNEYNDLKKSYLQLLNENAESRLEFSDEIKDSMPQDELNTNAELNDFSKLVDEIEKANGMAYPDLWRRISELS
ncbi:uncharacterized protein LOC100679245 [Nasonia vitripennis]|uniref:Uncharacterized protein n=1 Tax=Nasonia vitripennis TaxID=7425 RepID=A0A7M7GDS3_NASVI|nr:uncharacterized protein LOC100679245 [Nasonia vitripennis]